MEETEKLIKSMLQFLESSDDEDDENAYTYKHAYEKTISISCSTPESANFSKTEELSEQALNMTPDSLQPEEIPIDSDEIDDDQGPKVKYKIMEEHDSDEDNFFLIDNATGSTYTEDRIEVKSNGFVSPDNDNVNPSTVSSKSACMQYKPRGSRFFKRLTVDTIFVGDELEKGSDKYSLLAQLKESKKLENREESNNEGLSDDTTNTKNPHEEEEMHIESDPFIEEINRCIYGNKDNHPPDGSAEYFKAAEHYAIYGIIKLLVPSRETSPSTQSTDLNFSTEETLRDYTKLERDMSSSSSEELFECYYKFPPEREKEDELNFGETLPPLPSYLQSPSHNEIPESYSPLHNSNENLNISSLGANATPFFPATIPSQRNSCYNTSQSQNQYLPYQQNFYSPQNITPYFSVAASDNFYSMDHQGQRPAYQQQAYTNYHTQIGTRMPLNQTVYNPQQRHVTPVNTYLQSNQAQYNFNQDQICRVHGPMTNVTNSEHNNRSYYEHTSRFQTYQGQYICPTIIQQPPYPGAQYQHHQMSYVPRPRAPQTVGSSYSMQEREAAIRFRPPIPAHQNAPYNTYTRPRGPPPTPPPPPIRYPRFTNSNNIKDTRYGNSTRSHLNNKFINRASSIASKKRTTRKFESPPPTPATIKTPSSSPTNSHSTNNEVSKVLETTVDSNKTDIKKEKGNTDENS